MTAEKLEISPDQNKKVAAWLASVDDPTQPFFENGRGGYMSAEEIHAEIRRGTRFGREMLDVILHLPEIDQKQS